MSLLRCARFLPPPQLHLEPRKLTLALLQAQSGTGKTATFSISMLQSIDSSVRETQALVLSPTRELATQIQSVILALGGASLSPSFSSPERTGSDARFEPPPPLQTT